MHKLALLMEDIARASVSAVVGLFMSGDDGFMNIPDGEELPPFN